jgi:hypothetical protein
VQREDDGGQHGAAHIEPPEDDGHEKRGARVQRDVRQVIAERLAAEQAMQAPEHGVDDRVVLRRRAKLEPDASEPVEGLHRGRREVHVVIPEDAAAPRGLVRRERCEHKQRQQRPRALVRRSARTGLSAKRSLRTT